MYLHIPHTFVRNVLYRKTNGKCGQQLKSQRAQDYEFSCITQHKILYGLDIYWRYKIT